MTRQKRPQNVRGHAFDELSLGFSNLLDTFSEALSEVSQRLEDGQSGEFRRNFDFETSKGPVRAEAGIRVKFADAVAPDRNRAGPSADPRAIGARRAPRSTETRPSDTTPRSIDFEILEDAECWRLIADIPGAEERDVTLHEENGELVIETTGARRFRGSCMLPDTLAPGDLEMTLRNGILELVGYKKGDGAG